MEVAFEQKDLPNIIIEAEGNILNGLVFKGKLGEQVVLPLSGI